MGRVGTRVLTGLALALTAVALSGSAASAHAVLLGTDPPVGGVVRTAPATVRLHFSERVATHFSSVKLVAPDGQQVHAGPLRGVDGGRDLVVALPALNAGSYAVGWQALSDDGHTESGQFQFSVGAASGTTPRVLLPAGSRNPNLAFLFGQVRFAWFAAFMFLVGAAVVRLAVWDPAVRADESVRSAANARFQRRFSIALPAAWTVLAVSGALGLPLESVTASSRSGWAALHPAVLARLLAGTAYGRLWTAQMVLTVALALPVLALSRRPRMGGLGPRRWLASGALVAAALGSVVVLNGHARTAEHPIRTVVLLVAHLLTAAVWAGGLGALVLLSVPSWRAKRDAGPAGQLRRALLREILPRFSRLAVVSTILLLVTGVLSTRANLGALGNLFVVAYGRMVLAKLVLFAVAVGLGARHLLLLRRRLVGPGQEGTAASFERSTRAEALVLAGAVAVAAALVNTLPARYAQLATARPVDVKHQIGSDNIELVVAPTSQGDNQLLLSFVGGDGVLVPELNGPTARLRQPDGVERSVDLKALSAGAFSAGVSFPSAGSYRLAVTDAQGNATTFSFSVPKALRG